jgi:hypothetical protein
MHENGYTSVENVGDLFMLLICRWRIIMQDYECSSCVLRTAFDI